MVVLFLKALQLQCPHPLSFGLSEGTTAPSPAQLTDEEKWRRKSPQLSSGSGGGDGSFFQMQSVFHTCTRGDFIHRLASQHWSLQQTAPCLGPTTQIHACTHARTCMHAPAHTHPSPAHGQDQRTNQTRVSVCSPLSLKKKKIKCHIKKLIHPLILGLLEFHADHLKALCRVLEPIGHL